MTVSFQPKDVDIANDSASVLVNLGWTRFLNQQELKISYGMRE